MKRIFAIFIALAFMFCSFSPEAKAIFQQHEYVNVLISFKKTPGQQEKSLVRKKGGKVRKNLQKTGMLAVSLPRHRISELSNDSLVEAVEPDIKIYALGYRQELEQSWGVAHIGTGVLHNKGHFGEKVKVAVIDTGIDYNHPELSEIYKGGYDFINQDNDPMDDHGHGTLVAGIIAAKRNQVGVVGISPDIELYALKVLDHEGEGEFSDVLLALEWAAQRGIQIINNSYGTLDWEDEPLPVEQVEQAFDMAAQQGILNIAAAGNSGEKSGQGENVEYPARFDSTVAVAAVNSSNIRTSFSSTGQQVDIAAPGVSVNSTYLNGQFKPFSGTSAACPHVTGVAALIMAAGVTDIDTIKQILLDTADSLDNPLWYGRGLVNAAAAVKAAVSAYKSQKQPIISDAAEKAQAAKLYSPLSLSVLKEALEAWEQVFHDAYALKGEIDLAVGAVQGAQSRLVYLGDINNSGSVSALDALYVLKVSTGSLSLDDGGKSAADVNFDGAITAYDALMILKVSSGMCGMLNSF